MIELIPFGKKNKISKRLLIQKANIQEKDFNNELVKLRKKYIILTDTTTGGYWRPNTKQEYEEFIKKYQNRNYDTSRMIMLAYKEMEELQGDEM